MADNKGGTIYQNLNKFLNIDTIGGNNNLTVGVNYSPNSQSRKIIIKGNTPEEIMRKGLELEQKQKLQDKFFRSTDRGFQKAMQYEAARLPAYIDFEGMEYYPIIASALDLFMEEATTIGNEGKMLSIFSNKERIRLTLEDFFYNIVNVNTNLPFWTRNLPVKYDSIIPLLNGENITIKDISERLKNNPTEDIYTYAVQDNIKNIVVGKIIWCDLTRQNTEIYRIHLDDGTFVETTPDHEFMMRNGLYKRADQLIENESLMPFYTLISKETSYIKGYEKVYNPSTNRHKFAHRFISQEFNKNKEAEKESGEKYVTHHKNFNKLDNNPPNLIRMTTGDHSIYHAKLASKILKRPDVLEKRMKGIDKYLRSDKRRDRMSNEMSGIYPNYFKEYNNSELHDTHNIIRMDGMKELWSDSEKRNNVIDRMQLKLDNNCVNYIKQILGDKYISSINLCIILKNDEFFMGMFKSINNHFRKNLYKSLNSTTLINLIKRTLNLTYFEFVYENNNSIILNPKYIHAKNISDGLKSNKNVLTNHKVLFIEKLDSTYDAYCMEVVGPNNEQDRHNFPICSKDNNGNYTRNGVFVSNCKYGDNFVGLYGERKKGITAVRQMVNYEIERFERVQDGKMNVKFKERMTGDEFNTFEMAHFRLLGDDKMIPYGSSVLNKVRRVFRQLVLAEDAMLTYRLIRAGEKKVFKIDVGNIDEDDVEEYMFKVSDKFKRTPQIDQTNGQIDYRFNIMGVDEDYFIPVRNAGVQTGIDTLPGACLALDTKIELLDGRSLELNNIISEYESGKELWSYSINPKTGEIVPGKITWAGVTRRDTEVLKITLDNGETITCTPDHKFNTRIGDIREAKDLNIGESLWPFNKRFKQIKDSRNEYEQIYDHNLKKWIYTHRMVSNNINLEKFIFDIQNSGKCNVVHHKDFNRFNNNIQNLVIMNDLDHFKYHGAFSKIGSDAYKEKYNNDNEFKISVDNKLTIGRNAYHKKLKDNKEFKEIVTLKQSISAKNYINNLNVIERNERDIRSTNNSTKGRETFLNRYNTDKILKKNVIAKARKSSIATKNKPENKLLYGNNTRKLWLNDDFRKSIIDAQTIKYSELLLNIVIKLIKQHGKVTKILDIINNKNNEFYIEFFKLNINNKQLESKFTQFTPNSINKLAKHFNYKNVKELNKEISLYNHSIVSIEYLSDKQDTGTITIDGNEEFHNFHNFALTCGVFTKNSNLNDINDISYLRDNLFVGLGIPKPFLSFQDATGGGKNVAQFDIRFVKKINRLQQAIIQELNKMAMIHLYFLGFEMEDLSNFTLSLTNPSTQQELLKIELMQSKAQVYADMTRSEAGIAAMSHTTAKREILNWSDSKIVEDLRQQKMEKVIMQEFADAPVIIKKTGLFADIDKRYGADSENMSISGATTQPTGGAPMGGGMGGSMGGAPMGGVDNEIPPLGGEEGAIPPEGTGEEGSIPPPIAGLPNQTPNELPPIKESSRGNMDDESYNKFVNKLVYGDNHKENSIKQETSRLIMETESDILKFNNKALNLINEIENMVGDDLSENDKSIEEIIEEEPEINLNELNLEEEN